MYYNNQVHIFMFLLRTRIHLIFAEIVSWTECLLYRRVSQSCKTKRNPTIGKIYGWDFLYIKLGYWFIQNRCISVKLIAFWRNACILHDTGAVLSGSVGCAVRLETRRSRVQPPPRSQHSFVGIDHEIFSTVILSLPLIQEGQLSVSGERMCTIMVNRLED